MNWTGPRNLALVLALALIPVLALSACGGGSSSSSGEAQKFDPNKDVTITVWSGFTPGEREIGAFDSVIKDFEKLHPNVHVNSVAGINDDKIVAAIRAGNAPDVALSFSSDNTGAFCSSGAWIDLQPYIDRDHVDINAFPQAVRSYTEYNGTRCAMPLLADVYGLYYNKDMFKQAGLKAPPKTISELDSDAKKLTQGSGDNLSVVGFDPTIGFYENAAAHYATPWDAQWFDGDNAAFASDPAWADMLTWDKNLIDYYGSDALTRWEAGAGEEFSASNAFETGKVAMIMDGEYRTAFIKAEHPELNYGTAPMPVPDDQTDRYGSGYITGSIMGIPKGSGNPAAAWELIKYMTTNTHALVKLANGLANVPTTAAATNSPDLKLGPEFKPFLAMFKNPDSGTNPPKASGSAYQEILESFAQKWQAGHVSDLQSGLQDTADQVDAQEQNASGGQAP